MGHIVYPLPTWCCVYCDITDKELTKLSNSWLDENKGFSDRAYWIEEIETIYFWGDEYWKGKEGDLVQIIINVKFISLISIYFIWNQMKYIQTNK